MQLYAITDRRLLPGLLPGEHRWGEHHRGRLSDGEREALLERAAGWARGGVTYIQLREKDLSPEALAELASGMASRMAAAVRASGARLLVNGLAEIARDAGADGVHLPEGWTAKSIRAARQVFAEAGRPCTISVACHTVAGPSAARAAGADLALFAPVFRPHKGPATAGLGYEPGFGLEGLRAACAQAAGFPVFALGGVTVESAPACAESGATGVAAIRMFLGSEWRTLVR